LPGLNSLNTRCVSTGIEAVVVLIYSLLLPVGTGRGAIEELSSLTRVARVTIKIAVEVTVTRRRIRDFRPHKVTGHRVRFLEDSPVGIRQELCPYFVCAEFFPLEEVVVRGLLDIVAVPRAEQLLMSSRSIWLTEK